MTAKQQMYFPSAGVMGYTILKKEIEMVKIKEIENITIGEMKELYDRVAKITIREALPIMREFRDKHKLTDKQALKVFGIAEKLFYV